MRPLEGLRIADFTLHAAGPFATHLLSMLGAECIKIESSLRPDIFRRPHPVYGRMEAASFDQVASNKASVTLNLKDPRGLDLAKRLVAISDVVAESFRPGVMERLGLGFDELKKIKPQVVMVSVSAAGQCGPESRHAGYAPLFGASGGLGYLTGHEDGPPVELRHVMDHSAGLNAAAAALAALFRMREVGEGQHVDVAARDVATGFIGDALLHQAVTGETLFRRGNDAPPAVPNGVYPCLGEDSWVTISVSSQEAWRRFATAAGKGEWLEDSRFQEREQRWLHRKELDEQIAAWTAGQSAEDVTQLLQAEGVAAFPSFTARHIAEDSHLNERGAIRELVSPDGQKRKVVGPPWRFSKTPASIDRWTPELGEHNSYVFGELLGLSEHEIEHLQEEGAIQ